MDHRLEQTLLERVYICSVFVPELFMEVEGVVHAEL